MAEGDTGDKGKVFLRRAFHLNLAFVFAITVLFVASLSLYSLFAVPVSVKLLLYVYSVVVGSALFSYLVALLLRRRFPVSTSEKLWSYKAVRIYFWSYILLSVPFFLSFLFYVFAGNLSSLLIGYLLSLCGLIIFRPRRGDVR